MSEEYIQNIEKSEQEFKSDINYINAFFEGEAEAQQATKLCQDMLDLISKAKTQLSNTKDIVEKAKIASKAEDDIKAKNEEINKLQDIVFERGMRDIQEQISKCEQELLLI